MTVYMETTRAECTIPAAVGALASVIAKEISDEDLAVLAAVFTQLGDSLTVISAIRSRNTDQTCEAASPDV
jgi:hypothetical protein